MNVRLTPKLEQLVQNKVRSGEYTSANEVVREALRLMEERDGLLQLRKDEIRGQISTGLESLRRGRGIAGGDAFRELDRRHERYKRAHGK